MEHDGRVVDDGAEGISHSEGQGYGLLLAQAFGDHAAFDAIEAWTQSHLLVRQDALMAWKWSPVRGVTDWHNATDGDLFRAWALLRARRDSGWTAPDPAPIAHAIATLCLADDPRAPDEPLLLPGAEARRSDTRVLVNPSYLMGRAMRELGTATQSHALIRAADHGETLLRELCAWDFVPDWIDVTRSGFDAPREHELRAGYDALRVPLYLIWSGRPDHPAVIKGTQRLLLPDDPTHLAVRRDRAGRVTDRSNLPGYHALLDLPQCRITAAAHAHIADQPYYPATLQLLCNVAEREGSHCSQP